MNYKEAYDSWLNDDYFDSDTKSQLLSMKDDEKLIEDSFYKDLEFGTAGLRGIIGVGTNRMNVYTVRKATQGLADYIISRGEMARGVVIAYDSRRKSGEFADEAALCLAANGIKAYVFESLRPTPELSFAVRSLKCIAGINITASHNPREYNGYKVYWEDGAQITPPHDKGIMERVRSIEGYASVKTMPLEDALSKGLYNVIGAQIDDKYISEIKKCVLHPESIQSHASDINIVYTPLHGTGNIPVRRILEEIGFKNVHVVKEQELPDGEFPTISYPNPETKEAFELALNLANDVDADLVLATDPDADRLGVYVKTEKGRYMPLTGNMSGCLLAEYETSQKKALGLLPDDGYIIKSIVSSNMANAVAGYYGIELKEVMTGFKYIGLEMLKSEKTGRGSYVFGFEESYGCLIGTYARDKDAVSAAMALCEAAAYYKSKGLTLADVMQDMYDRFGYFLEGVVSVTAGGKEGAIKISETMRALRENAPKCIGDREVLKVRDYKEGYVLEAGKKTALPVSGSDVLYYELAKNAWACVRPSGTEPKIKLYFGVRESTEKEASLELEKLGCELKKITGIV